jgi:hypothetical protein
MALADPGYREICKRNHAEYLAAGIRPWLEGGGLNSTLIETHDEPDGGLDAAMIELDRNAELFSAVIRCTCDDTVDNKTIRKWARTLRYVAHRKKSQTRLKAFMKKAGGVNACADRYTKYLRA